MIERLDTEKQEKTVALLENEDYPYASLVLRNPVIADDVTFHDITAIAGINPIQLMRNPLVGIRDTEFDPQVDSLEAINRRYQRKLQDYLRENGILDRPIQPEELNLITYFLERSDGDWNIEAVLKFKKGLRENIQRNVFPKDHTAAKLLVGAHLYDPLLEEMRLDIGLDAFVGKLNTLEPSDDLHEHAVGVFKRAIPLATRLKRTYTTLRKDRQGGAFGDDDFQGRMARASFNGRIFTALGLESEVFHRPGQIIKDDPFGFGLLKDEGHWLNPCDWVQEAIESAIQEVGEVEFKAY